MSDNTEENQSKKNETRNGLLWCAFGVAVMFSGKLVDANGADKEEVETPQSNNINVFQEAAKATTVDWNKVAEDIQRDSANRTHSYCDTHGDIDLENCPEQP